MRRVIVGILALTTGAAVVAIPSVLDPTFDDEMPSEGSSEGTPETLLSVADGVSTETHEPFLIIDLVGDTDHLECSLNGGDYVACEAPVFAPMLGSDGLYQNPVVGLNTMVIRSTDSGQEVAHTWEQLSIVAEGSTLFDSGELTGGQVMPPAVSTGGWKGITRINCLFDGARYDDPIVLPGQEGEAHLHYFYGASGIDSATTFESLYSSAESGCSGGTLNRSGYWIPALLAPSYDYSTGERLLDAPGDPAWEPVLAKVGEGARDNRAAHEVFYYSAGVTDVQSIQVPPTGLKIVAGDRSATPDDAAQDSSIVRWHCLSWGSTDQAGGPWSDTIPDCRAPDMLRMDIFFPSCWNGKDLDSDDHQSHMAYPSGPVGNVTCPATHPVPIVRVSNHFAFPLFPDQLDPVTKASEGFRLASDDYTVTGNGGLSLHADWWNGWHPEAMQLILDGCIKAERDCHDGNLATLSTGSSGAEWQGSLALGPLAPAEEVIDIPPIVNGGAGPHDAH
jgi:Domain of unknown function (DUF1996)